MRRRVFLVGVKGDPLPPPTPQFARCLGRRENRSPTLLTGVLPYPITAAEALDGLPVLAPIRYPQTGPRAIRAVYREWVSGALSVEAFFAATSVPVP